MRLEERSHCYEVKQAPLVKTLHPGGEISLKFAFTLKLCCVSTVAISLEVNATARAACDLHWRVLVYARLAEQTAISGQGFYKSPC